MKCYRCKNTRKWKGLPCVHCKLSQSQKRTIRGRIYGDGWFKPYALFMTLQVKKPFAELILKSAKTVLDSGNQQHKAVLALDVRRLLRVPPLCLMGGSAQGRLMTKLPDIVGAAAQESGVNAELLGDGNVLDSAGHGRSIQHVQAQKRAEVTQQLPAQYWRDAAKVMGPTQLIMVTKVRTKQGQRKKGREAVRHAVGMVAPSISGQISCPGDLQERPYVLYQLEIDPKLGTLQGTGNEFSFKDVLYHYPDRWDKPAGPSNSKQLLGIGGRDLGAKLQRVGTHGPCALCNEIKADLDLRKFERAFAAASVKNDESDNHRIDRELAELGTKFDTLHRQDKKLDAQAVAHNSNI